MSGGVDSSTAAAILADEGHDVTGLAMHLHSCHRPAKRSCCSARDRMDARAVCDRLGISLQVVDLREDFRRMVVAPFVEEYLAGRTPSPCILCNELVKFPTLLREAKGLCATIIATGHYARVEEEGGIYHLLRALDPGKDQSYFLFGLTQEILERLRLPLGRMSKGEVRTMARARGLTVSEKAESQEVCFVADDDCAGYVEQESGRRLSGPGDFVDLEGKRLGRHRGIHAYTIGQRRGLGVGGGPRRYVVRIDVDANEVVLGDDDDLMSDEMTVERTSWIHPSFARDREARVRIRSTHSGEDAALKVLGEGAVRVVFERRVRAIAPGQAAVFYDGEEVLGGGWIR